MVVAFLNLHLISKFPFPCSLLCRGLGLERGRWLSLCLGCGLLNLSPGGWLQLDIPNQVEENYVAALKIALVSKCRLLISECFFPFVLLFIMYEQFFSSDNLCNHGANEQRTGLLLTMHSSTCCFLKIGFIFFPKSLVIPCRCLLYFPTSSNGNS